MSNLASDDLGAPCPSEKSVKEAPPFYPPHIKPPERPPTFPFNLIKLLRNNLEVIPARGIGSPLSLFADRHELLSLPAPNW